MIVLSLEVVLQQYQNLFILFLVYRFTTPDNNTFKPTYDTSYEVDDVSEIIRASVNRGQ